MATISDQEFSQFQRFIFEEAGITMGESKKALVSGRLARRLQHFRIDSYGEYFRMLESGKAVAEVQTAIDLLTTNETYFFREPKHFDHLRAQAADWKSKARQTTLPFRVWSAASSTGEEAYSIAMLLSDCLGTLPFEIVGTDISTRVLQRARAGHYPQERTKHIPLPYLQRFCLKGTGEQAGTLLVQRELRNKVLFSQVNLNHPLPQLGVFDVIFLRNVMIYFNAATKREVVARVLTALRPGGLLLIGHSETLNDICETVTPLAPSVYRKP